MSDKPKPRACTPRQQIFCAEFLKDLNIEQAAVRAGYSETFARKKSYLMLRLPHIQAHIQELNGNRAKRTKLDGDEVLKRLTSISLQAELEGDYGPAIRALELLGKHLALFTDKSEQNVTINNPFATGEKPEDIARDTERLMKVAAPFLKVVHGGKTGDDD